jgi:hypothetical protein
MIYILAYLMQNPIGILLLAVGVFALYMWMFYDVGIKALGVAVILIPMGIFYLIREFKDYDKE